MEVAHVGEVGLQPLHSLLIVGGLGIELVVSLDFGGKPPVVEAKGFTDHGVEAARPTRYKLDEPSGEGVHNILSLEAGLRDQISEVGLVVIPTKGACDLSGPGDALDIVRDVTVAFVIIDAEVGGPTTVLFVPHWAFAALIGGFLEFRDTFAEDGEDLLVGDVASGALVQDSLGVVVDGVGSIVSAGSVGHGGLEGGISNLLHDVRANLFAVSGKGGKEGSGGVELSFADEVFQVAGRRRWRRRGNGECR
jgi:hypothetical protein